MKRKAADAVEGVQLTSVKPIWLDVPNSPPHDRFLLLEDVETGDVHMPLIYMKAVFEANYSRKLSSLKNRLVVLPDESETDGEGEGGEDKASQGFLYWKWAFESPHEVKVLVRKMLGEENTPSGHLRLVLLPIVYNAMSQKSELRTSVLFKRLHGAMKRSAYYPMLKHPPPEEMQAIEADGVLKGPLFHGPLNTRASRDKYMNSYREAAGNETGGSGSRGATTVLEAAQALEENRFGSETTAAGLSLEQLLQEQRQFRREVQQQLRAITAEMGHMAQTINTLSLQIVTQQSSRHMPTWMNSPQPVTQQPNNMPTQSSAEQLSLALSHGSPDRHLDLINRRLATSLPSTRPLSSLLAQTEAQRAGNHSDAQARTSAMDYASLMVNRLGRNQGGHLGIQCLPQLPNLNASPLTLLHGGDINSPK